MCRRAISEVCESPRLGEREDVLEPFGEVPEGKITPAGLQDCHQQPTGHDVAGRLLHFQLRVKFSMRFSRRFSMAPLVCSLSRLHARNLLLAEKNNWVRLPFLAAPSMHLRSKFIILRGTKIHESTGIHRNPPPKWSYPPSLFPLPPFPFPPPGKKRAYRAYG